MSYVVTEPCIKCKYTDCVEVCPVNCFYEGANFIVIHPDECIDCGACEPVCPSKAIFPDGEVPEQYREYIALNQEFSQKCRTSARSVTRFRLRKTTRQKLASAESSTPQQGDKLRGARGVAAVRQQRDFSLPRSCCGGYAFPWSHRFKL